MTTKKAILISTGLTLLTCLTMFLVVYGMYISYELMEYWFGYPIPGMVIWAVVINFIGYFVFLKVV